MVEGQNQALPHCSTPIAMHGCTGCPKAADMCDGECQDGKQLLRGREKHFTSLFLR